jgi:hypothetical protein
MNDTAMRQDRRTPPGTSLKAGWKPPAEAHEGSSPNRIASTSSPGQVELDDVLDADERIGKRADQQSFSCPS